MDKPFESKIKIIKSQDFFEVYMPPYFPSLSTYIGNFFMILLSLTFCLVLGSFGLAILSPVFADIYSLRNIIATLPILLRSRPFYQFILASLFVAFILIFYLIVAIVTVSMPFVLIGTLFYIIDVTLFTPITKRYLRISENRIILSRSFVWQKKRGLIVSSGLIEEISKLILTREHFYDDHGSTKKKEAKLEIIIESQIPEKQRLNLQKDHINATFIQEIDKRIIEFNNEYKANAELANAELAWLAYEISEWLDKPLTIVEPN